MIMNKSIPKQIQLIMSREDLNYCETFDYEGKTYYILSYVSENGEPQPTGLPIIYYIDKENPVQLSFDKSLLILSKLPDDGEEQIENKIGFEWRLIRRVAARTERNINT